MKKFYVSCGDADWIIKADKFDVSNGILFFATDREAVAVFNTDCWTAVRIYEEDSQL